MLVSLCRSNERNSLQKTFSFLVAFFKKENHMIKKDFKRFFSLCLAGIVFCVQTSVAQAVETAPVTSGLTAQVLKLANNATSVPNMEFKQSQVVKVQYGTSVNPPVFAVLTSGSVQICKITPLDIGSVVVEGLAVGTCKLAVNQEGDATHAKAAELVLQFQIIKAKQVISLDPQPAGELLKVGEIVERFMTAGDSGNPVVFSLSPTCKMTRLHGNFIFTIESTAMGACSISATQAGNENYAQATYGPKLYAYTTIGDTTLKFTSPESAFVKSTLDLTFYKKGSTKPITIATATFDVCIVDSTTKKMISKKTGVCTLRAEVLADSNYKGATTTADIQILMIGGDPLVLTGINSLLVDASANLTVKGSGSSKPVVLRNLQPDNCSIDGITVKGLSGGLCRIEASQEGDSNYFPAKNVYHEFNVDKKPQIINLKPIPTVAVRQQHVMEVMDSNSTLPVYFKVADQCTAMSVVGNTITGLNAGTCDITATRPGDNKFADAAPFVFSMSIQKGAQGILISSADSFGRGDFTPVSASSNQPITPSTPLNISVAPASICTLEANQVKGVGLGICTVSVHQLGDANYLESTATKQVPVVIGKSTLKFEQLPSLRVNVDGGLVGVSSTYSGSPIIVNASPYSVCWYDAATKILTGLTAGDCIVTANQHGDAEYLSANEIRTTVRVLLGSVEIYFTQVSPMMLNAGSITLLATTSAKPSANPPVVAFESLTPAICSVSGTSLTPLATGICTIRATQASNDNYLAATPVTRDITILAPATTTTVSSSLNPAKHGTMVTLTATVSGDAVTGLVGFTTDGTAISHCTSVQLIAGVATCSTNQLAVGTRQIVANYGGDAKNQSSQSATFEQKITSLDWLPAILNLLLSN